MRIVELINKLLTLSTSPNENEAAQTAAKASQLLLEHNLNLIDVAKYNPTTTPGTQSDSITQDEIDTKAKKIYWRGTIANTIASTNFCKFWWTGGKMNIAGRPHNIAITKSLYVYLTRVVERLSKESVKAEKKNYQIALSQLQEIDFVPLTEPNWRRWKTSFITGCSQRLCERMIEQHKQINDEGIPGTGVTGLACREAHQKEQEAIALWRRVTRRTDRSRRRSASAEMDSPVREVVSGVRWTYPKRSTRIPGS